MATKGVTVPEVGFEGDLVQYRGLWMSFTDTLILGGLRSLGFRLLDSRVQGACHVRFLAVAVRDRRPRSEYSGIVSP